ncbi:MAG: hypothetical protein LBC40_05545, partial [Dysgonamonadaceae bacterium]|nr:hypothetical protein [Dysgonamonadaceae bacterium]
MKHLQIKQLKALSTLKDWNAKAALMKKEAASGMVDTINWKAYSHKPDVKFYAAYTESSFSLLYDVREDAVRAVNTTSHSPVYQDSCVEFFVRRPGATTYRNFEFNCIGAALSAVRESKASFRHLPTEEMDTIITYTSLPKLQPIEINTPSHWQILIEIPLILLDISESNPAGITLRANFYKCGD